MNILSIHPLAIKKLNKNGKFKDVTGFYFKKVNFSFYAHLNLAKVTFKCKNSSVIGNNC
jgi:hypothetical protein